MHFLFLFFLIHKKVLNYQGGDVVVFRVIPCLRKAISSGQNLYEIPFLLSRNTILILDYKIQCNQI